MTFTAVWLWTLARSLILMGLALPWCGLLVRWIRTSPVTRRRWQFGLLLLPVLFPELLTGYAYSQMTKLLITGFWTRELWFDLLLWLRVIPIGTVLWYCSPPSPLSREAFHARRMAIRPEVPSWKRWGIIAWYWFQGPARAGLFAASGLLLVLFHEFELASLLATTSWTVWLFDAQAGGLILSESLKSCMAPACCTWLLCGALLWMVCRKSLRKADQSSGYKHLSVTGSVICWTYLCLALGLLVIYPSLLVGGETLSGVWTLISDRVQLQGMVLGIVVAAGFALISGFTTDLIAGWLLHGSSRRGGDENLALRNLRRLGLVAAGFGLSGSLVIALVTVALFQQPWLRGWYDTPVPRIIGQVLWLLPRAILLHGMLRAVRQPVGEHLARLLGTGRGQLIGEGEDSRTLAASATGRELLWQLHGRRAMIVRLLLCHWAYWELTLPDILKLTGLEPAPVRLYIDMHFSRNAVLTAKAGLTMLIPVLVVAACWPLFKHMERLDVDKS